MCDLQSGRRGGHKVPRVPPQGLQGLRLQGVHDARAEEAVPAAAQCVLLQAGHAAKGVPAAVQKNTRRTVLEAPKLPQIR